MKNNFKHYKVSLIFFLTFFIFTNVLSKEINFKALEIITSDNGNLVVGKGNAEARIDKEIEQYHYKPLKNVYYNVDENYFRITEQFSKLKQKYENCVIISYNCQETSISNIIIKKKFGKYILINKKWEKKVGLSLRRYVQKLFKLFSIYS